MIEFEFYWETDEGEACTIIHAETLRAAIDELAKQNPNDKGADGYVILPDGTEKGLDW